MYTRLQLEMCCVEVGGIVVLVPDEGIVSGTQANAYVALERVGRDFKLGLGEVALFVEIGGNICQYSSASPTTRRIVPHPYLLIRNNDDILAVEDIIHVQGSYAFGDVT
ncbi:hypothetical protein EC991_002672 [Linnemannia zychae]|nr:hypothetical protein EC991_002672 [Linnemannia zychae]